MRRVKKEDGYKLDDFMVASSAIVDQVDSDESQVEYDSEEADQDVFITDANPASRNTQAPTTPQKAPVHSSAAPNKAMSSNDSNNFESLDALLGDETDKSISDNDVSDFVPSDSDSATPTPTPRTKKPYHIKTASRKPIVKLPQKPAKHASAATKIPKAVQKPHHAASSKTEASPPNAHKRGTKRDLTTYDNEAAGDSAGFYNGAKKYTEYGQLVEMFGLSPTRPQKASKVQGGTRKS